MNNYRLTYPLFGFLMLAASCSQEEVNENGNRTAGGRIEFSASLPEITTRATEVDATTLENFQVSSFIDATTSLTPYFLDKSFSKSSTGKFVSSDPECIWPNNSSLVWFMAFAPSCEQMREAGGFGDTEFVFPEFADGEAVATDACKLSAFRIAPDIASQVDFVTAIGSGSLWEDEETPVKLNFHHQLSRIELKAWGASNSFNLEIAGVRLGGVGTQGVFCFAPQADADDTTAAGRWESVDKGSVEYIYREGDVIVTLDKTEGSLLTADKAVSILGKQLGDKKPYDNSAMLIPSDNSAWDYKDNAGNGENNADGMYFSVLVRVTDITPYATGSIVYPYAEGGEGMEVIYLAVDKATKKAVKTRLYKQGEDYFTDADCTSKYDLDANSAEVKAFGWAALPVADNWKPGCIYTYTLNYTNGVGLRNPRDPKPGEPIISDRVLVDVEMTDWVKGSDTDVSVPRK